MRHVAIISALTATAWLVVSYAVPRADDSPIVTAMQDEMKRSMSDLRMKDEPPPYFIAYEVDDLLESNAEARLGAIVANTSRHLRVLQVEVRVGDYQFDSSRFISANRGGGGPQGTIVVPVDDNYDAMRRQLWLATDAAYKRAVTMFARKKAAFQNRSNAETLPDFSKETPSQTAVPAEPSGSTSDWADRVKEISAAFKSATDIENSDVNAVENRGTRYYLNSEGFRVVAPLRSASLRVTADTQAGDGTALRDGFTNVEASLRDMPPLPELVRRARELATRLSAERRAPIGEEYTGPILLESQASADLIEQAFVPLLLARRPPDSDAGGGRGGPGPQNQTTPFLSRIGLRVLPDAFSVSDTPSLKQFNGKTVPGSYLVDDEGVPAKDVTLVENGKLLTLLTGRTPQKKLLQSNGHGRSGTVQAGVVQLRSGQGVPLAELKKRYLALLKDQDKEFGYIVRGIGGIGGGPNAPVIAHAVRVGLDGSEQLVRGLRFATIASTAFRNILDASDEKFVDSYLTNTGDPVSVIVPSLLFEELEIQQTRDIVQKPPVVPSPLKN